MACVKVPGIESEIFFMPLGSHHNFGLLLFKKPKKSNFSNPIELFSYCKNITKNMTETNTSVTSGLYIPCFNKQIKDQKLDFMHGLPTNKEGDHFISDTMFNLDVAIKGQKKKSASLKFSPDDNSYIIDEDYVMVLTHPELEEGVKVPFMCGLVTQQDWTLA